MTFSNTSFSFFFYWLLTEGAGVQAGSPKHPKPLHKIQVSPDVLYSSLSSYFPFSLSFYSPPHFLFFLPKGLLMECKGWKGF